MRVDDRLKALLREGDLDELAAHLMTHFWLSQGFMEAPEWDSIRERTPDGAYGERFGWRALAEWFREVSHDPAE